MSWGENLVMGDSNKNSFLFGLTLTELAFILFFILLFFASLTVKEKTTKIDSLNAYKKIVESIPKFKDKTISEKEIWLKELVEMSNLRNRQQGLIENNNALNKENDAYKKIVELIPEFKDKSELEKKIWLKELVEKNNSHIKNQELIEINKALRERLEEVIKVNTDKLGEVEFLRKQVIGLGGNAYPPCWENPKTKKPEYIYNIIISENGITTFKGYKKYLDEKFLKLPGSNDVLGKSDISVNEFMVKVSGVYQRSKEEECRHYVRIFDEAISKNAYKYPLHRIEQYFYKFEPNNPSYSHFVKEYESTMQITKRDLQNISDFKSISKSSKQLNNKFDETNGKKSTAELMRIVKKRLEYENSLSDNSSVDNLTSKNPVLDSKDTITSPLDLIERLEMLKAPNSNH